MMAPQQPDGAQQEPDGVEQLAPETVTRSVEIDAEVQEVWETITTNEGRERWIEPDPNRVLIVDAEAAPDRISWWWWSADEPATHVVLRVVAIPTGTRVVVTETGPSSFPIAQLAASFDRILAFA
jgi:uncharacterized protein YndB with AHSA1/START domain